MALGWRGQYYKYREFSLNLLAIYKQRSDVQAFLEIILSLTTLIIFIVFAIKPTALTMITLNNEINSKEETLNGLNQKISDLQTANSVYIENENIIPSIDAALFTIPQPDTISVQILGIGTKNSVKIVGISVGQATILGQKNLHKNPTDLKPLPNNSQSLAVSIVIEGDYSNTMSFLMDIEKLRIPVKVDSLTINSSPLKGTILTTIVNTRVPYMGNKN